MVKWLFVLSNCWSYVSLVGISLDRNSASSTNQVAMPVITWSFDMVKVNPHEFEIKSWIFLTWLLILHKHAGHNEAIITVHLLVPKVWSLLPYFVYRPCGEIWNEYIYNVNRFKFLCNVSGQNWKIRTLLLVTEETQ